jgi:hypothetical protein
MGELIEDKLLKAAFGVFDKMKPGQVIFIKDYAPNKPELFLQCAEQYQQTYNNLELNPSRTKIKKYASIRNFSGGASTDSK